MENKRGMLIVFEGLDRSGKSTQCEKLVRYLRRNGEHVEHMRFPNRTTPIGQMINTYLTGQSQQEDHVIHLLFAANRWESAKEIENCISAGTTVVIDRYSYSGCVYSAAKEMKNMDLAWCRQPEVGLPRPDVCLFLDISAEEAAKRKQKKTEPVAVMGRKRGKGRRQRQRQIKDLLKQQESQKKFKEREEARKKGALAIVV